VADLQHAMRVAALFVYPVKSCAGIALDRAALGPRGILHDREFMLVDAMGRFITQREQPRLALIRPKRTACCLALEHPHLYQLMFQEDLPLTFARDPDSTPGRRSFDNLVSAVRRCLDSGMCPAHDDPFRLALLIWAAEHGLVLARISRPTFPWAPIDSLVDEMVTRMMEFRSTPTSDESKRRLRLDRGSAPQRLRGRRHDE
jgi:MOSC N-terminal beta barrel domain/Tetracyclin repressor-like, C-terminal domain